jgi:hypothetical protein
MQRSGVDMEELMRKQGPSLTNALGGTRRLGAA